MSGAPVPAAPRQGPLEWGADLAVLLGCWLLLLHYFPPELLLSPTVTTGGDTGSHYYTADFLAKHLLPKGSVVGWVPGNLGGYPLFQFYFPLPFVLMALVSYLGVPLTIAFKLVSVSGPFLLPLCVYLGLRLAGRPFPAPALGASCVLPFLFNETQSMWGGNIPSLLAGEMGYSLGLALLVAYLGAMHGDMDRQKHLLRNALLLTVVGFSHGCTLLFGVLAGLAWLFSPRLARRGVYIFKVYALSFCLMGFWIVPLVLFSQYNTIHNMVWIIDKWQAVVPPILMPFMALCLLHLGWGLWSRWRGRPGRLGAASLLLGWLCLGLVLYLLAFHLNVIDIRFFPFAWLAICVWAAVALGDWSRALAARAAAPVLLLLLCVLWVDGFVSFIPQWIRWNYQGFEMAPGWPDFKRLNDYLAGGPGDPRVLHEHADIHQRLGTTRAFENLPLFSGRSTMEGLYIQSSVCSPFVFYIQSETTQTPTTPLPDYNYSRFDLAQALPRLALFNVSQYVAVAEPTIKAADALAGLERQAQIGPYVVYRVKDNPGRYVTPLRHKPVLVLGRRWKENAFQWFRRGDFAVPLVFKSREEAGDRQRFAAVLHDDFHPLPRVALPAPEPVSEKVGFDRIEIETKGRGPLLIKMSYHPNWRVEGAERVYLASPAFMIVYPKADRVLLYFGLTWPNYLGQALTAFGLVALLLSLPGLAGLAGARGARGWVNGLFEAVAAWLERLLARPLDWLGRRALASGLAAVALTGLLLGLYVMQGGKVDSAIAYNLAKEPYEAKDYAKAEAMFRQALERWPSSPVVDQTINHWALTFYLRKLYPQAMEAYQYLMDNYPESVLVPEALYHIGHCHREQGQLDEARRYYQMVIDRFPTTGWAGHAKARLEDMKGR